MLQSYRAREVDESSRDVSVGPPGAGACSLTQRRRHLDGLSLQVANERQRRADTCLLFGQQAVKVVDASDGLVAVGDDDVAIAQAGASRGAVRFYGRHEDAAFRRQSMESHQAP